MRRVRTGRHLRSPVPKEPEMSQELRKAILKLPVAEPQTGMTVATLGLGDVFLRSVEACFSTSQRS